LDGTDIPTPAVLADDTMREEFLEFFFSLLLALQRDGTKVVYCDEVTWEKGGMIDTR
jgi:hypothetical protein